MNYLEADMKLNDELNLQPKLAGKPNTKHPLCKGYRDDYDPYDYSCGYDTDLDCEDCKYGVGRKDPEAKCNRSQPPMTCGVTPDA